MDNLPSSSMGNSPSTASHNNNMGSNLSTDSHSNPNMVNLNNFQVDSNQDSSVNSLNMANSPNSLALPSNKVTGTKVSEDYATVNGGWLGDNKHKRNIVYFMSQVHVLYLSS